jgi:hypothetical protein
VARRKPTSGTTRKSRPALTPEARENRLIAKAYDLVEQRLDDGTATSQETTHFLKLGSAKAKLELEKLRKETDLLVSKKEALDSAKRMEELYSEALNAMKRYGGHYNE